MEIAAPSFLRMSRSGSVCNGQLIVKDLRNELVELYQLRARD
jgi:hypothetical protein